MQRNYMEISTANIKPETAQYLTNKASEIEKNYWADIITVFKRNRYGFFIPVNDCLLDDYPDIPEDLKQAILYAVEEYCDYLIIDPDADIDRHLEFYGNLWNYKIETTSQNVSENN